MSRPSRGRGRSLDRDALAGQILVAGTLITATVVFYRGSFDPFSVVKATIVVAGALAVALWGVSRMTGSPSLRSSLEPFQVAVAAFLLAVLVSTVVSDHPLRSFVGAYSRYTGAVTYVACAGLAVATLRLLRGRDVAWIAYAVMAATGVVAVYAVLQRLGVDPWGWDRLDVGRGVFSTLGNPNFAAGYLGVGLVPVAWAVLPSRRSAWWRATWGVVLLAGLVGVVATRSSQGPIALAAGGTVLAGAWIRTWDRERYRLAASVGLAIAAIAVALVVGSGLAGAGPLSALGGEESFAQRLDFWRAGAAMAADEPVSGVGLDLYGTYFRQYRTQEAALRLSVDHHVDAPHNVPLAMFAGGGFLLGLAYLAVVAVTAYALLRALRRSEGERLLLVGAMGGAWFAYQVQSLVSIDEPALAATHWVLAGGVVTLGMEPSDSSSTRSGRRSHGRRPQRWPLALAVAVAILLLVPLTRPLRADLAAERATNRSGQEAVSAMDVAVARAPWEPSHHNRRGNVLAEQERFDEALASYEAAVIRDPGGYVYVLNAAKTAANAGAWQRAEEWYQRLLEVEPHHPAALVEVARFHFRRDELEAGASLLERALAVDPANADWWMLLGRARYTAGDEEAALAAFERALEADSDHGEAADAVATLKNH